MTFAGGDVTGNFTIDGSANVSDVDLQVVNDSHNHDSRYFTESQSDARFLGISANAASASKWATARTLSLSGDASGSASFDGSANATLSVTVANNSHNHTIANITSLQSALDAKLSTTGTAADSTKWGGYKFSTSSTGSASDTIYFRT